jgi:hypothetical protein
MLVIAVSKCLYMLSEIIPLVTVQEFFWQFPVFHSQYIIMPFLSAVACVFIDCISVELDALTTISLFICRLFNYIFQ